MSIRVMTLIWDSGTAHGYGLLTLLALADWSDDQGRCYPSVSAIAERCRTTNRGARKILLRLRDEGLISVIEKPTFRRSTRYQINLVMFTRREEPGSSQRGMAFLPERGTGFLSERNGVPLSERNPVPLREERRSGDPSVDPSMGPSVDPSGGGEPPALREPVRPDNGAGMTTEIGPETGVLEDPRTAEEAWVLLMRFYDGEFDRADTPIPIPPRTKEAFLRIGGWRRTRGWDNRPQDISFAMDKFIEIWRGLDLNRARKSDRVMMQ